MTKNNDIRCKVYCCKAGEDIAFASNIRRFSFCSGTLSFVDLVAKIQQWLCIDSSALPAPTVACLTFAQSAAEMRKQTANCHFIHTQEDWKKIVEAHNPEVILRLAAWVYCPAESDSDNWSTKFPNQPLVVALQQYLSKHRSATTGKLTKQSKEYINPREWPKISSSIRDIKTHYTVIVIGSGYGGSICACRMSRAGKDVCLLEQGKEVVPGDYPNTLEEVLPEMKLTLPDGSLWPQGFTDGFFDVTVSKNMFIWKGCGLGGGSLVNSSISIKPDKRVFESWPTEFQQDMQRLEEGFQRATDVLCPQQYPHQTTKPLTKFKALQKASGFSDNCNLAFTNTTFERRINDQGVQQSACVLCGDCNTGCNYGAKNTLLMNYLPDAKQHGAEIFCRVWVNDIQELDERKWQINCKYAGDSSTPPHNFLVTADIVILGAGSLGSTEILLRSKDKHSLAISNMCGQRFGADGDFFGMSYNGPDVVNGCGFGNHTPKEMEGKECGPCITGVWDLRSDSMPLSQGMIIEDINFPGAFAPLLSSILPVVSVIWGENTSPDDIEQKLLRILESIAGGPYVGATQHNLMLGGMSTYGSKDQSGQLKLVDGRLCIDFPDAIDPDHNSQVKEVLHQAALNMQSTYIKDPLANPSVLEGHDIPKIEASIHPLGGCIMGDSYETGVVNHKGQVWSGPSKVYNNLYVSDGAIIPTSLGVNPLLTISALAERICLLLAADHGWTIDYSVKTPTFHGENLLRKQVPGW